MTKTRKHFYAKARASVYGVNRQPSNGQKIPWTVKSATVNRQMSKNILVVKPLRYPEINNYKTIDLNGVKLSCL